MKYGIIGESDSDVATLRALIVRLSLRAGQERPGVKTRSFDGCSRLLQSGWAQLELFEKGGCDRLMVHFDADRNDPTDRRRLAEEKIVQPADISVPCLVCMPVQEIEAWLLSDTAAITKVIPKCRDLKEYTSPERVNDPKEELLRICRDPKTKKSDSSR